MDELDHRELRTVHGRTVRVEWIFDYDTGRPWVEHEGHGPVRESHTPHALKEGDKRPGERPLNRADRSAWQWHYDWQGAIKRAREEGWGLDIDDFMGLMCELRRVPTKGQVIERAVERDFQHLKGWANEEWYWCGIEVTDVETGVERSLWGIESTNKHGYHEEIIDERGE